MLMQSVELLGGPFLDIHERIGLRQYRTDGHDQQFHQIVLDLAEPVADHPSKQKFRTGEGGIDLASSYAAFHGRPCGQECAAITIN